MQDFLQQEFMNNKIIVYLYFVIILVSAGLLHFMVKIIRNRQTFNDKPLLKNILKGLFGPAIWLIALYISLRTLELSVTLYEIINILYIVIITWFVTKLAVLAFYQAADQFIKRTKSEEDQRRIRPLLSFFKLSIWLLGFIYLLHYLGFDVTTALAGLGIGGIAIALAAQTILGDLFSYFVINFDRPFEIGDFVIFDDKIGSIEKIGIKSTKIKALSGEQLVVSNSNLTNSRIHNFKRMERRRILFLFGVVYQTTSEKLKQIPQIVENIIKENQSTEFDRCHFKTFGNFSLDFEVVYFVNTNDIKVYMDVQQEINLKIFEEFERRDIQFAYPTQTLYVNKSN